MKHFSSVEIFFYKRSRAHIAHLSRICTYLKIFSVNMYLIPFCNPNITDFHKLDFAPHWEVFIIRGPWATSLTLVTLAHMTIFFESKYTFHFLLPHLTLGSHNFNKLAYVLCQKAFMWISADFNKSTAKQTIPTREEMLLIYALNELQHMWNFQQKSRMETHISCFL
jgi:hypothetical protein